MKEENFLEINCSKLPGILTKNYIVTLNSLVTEPPTRGKTGLQQIENVAVGDMPEFETGREEDYHQLRPEGEGILENLIHVILPQRCNERNDALWLSSVIMCQIAQNQAFGEGNKRTSYLAGTMFWIWAQYEEGLQKGVYVNLTVDLTNILSEVAIAEKDAEDIYNYLRSNLESK